MTVPAPPRALRILFLAPQPFFEVRGTPLAVMAMAKTLVAQGHSVDLLTYPQGASVQVPGLRHRRSLRLPVGHVRAGPSLAKLALDVPFLGQAVWRILRGRYDVVHAVEEAAHLIAPFARLLRLPLVVDVDSSIPDQLQESGFATRGPLLWAARAFEGHALRHAAAVITVCRSLTEGVRARVPLARVFQVEDAPLQDDAAPPPSPAALASLRTELSLDARPVVLYSGNFESYQGVEMLVDAAALVPQAQFVMMGGEPAQVARLAARSRDRGGACRFSGRRPPTDLPLFLGLTDVLCSPRVKGVNTPFKIYTYMASGTPLVATRILSHTQILDDTLAFLVPPSAEGLAHGIADALRDAKEAAARAERAQSLVAREFSRERYAEKVATAYAGVMASL